MIQDVYVIVPISTCTKENYMCPGILHARSRWTLQQNYIILNFYYIYFVLQDLQSGLLNYSDHRLPRPIRAHHQEVGQHTRPKLTIGTGSCSGAGMQFQRVANYNSAIYMYIFRVIILIIIET